MTRKPTYEELEQRVMELEELAIKLRRGEEALRREKEFAESILSTAQAIILVLDTEGRIVRFNPYMEQISGYILDEVEGKDWFTTFLPKRDQHRIRELFQQAVSAIQTRGNVNPIITKDGQEREIEWYDKTLNDGDGNIIGVLAIGHDISERKRAEQALREAHDELEQQVKQRTTKLVEANEQLKQEIEERKRAEEQTLVANERLQYLLSSTTAVIYTAKTSGDYAATFVTDNVAQMLGYEAREFVEKPSFWFDRVHPEDKQGLSVEVPRLFEQGLNSYEYRFRHKDDTYIWVRDEMKLVPDEAGNPLEIVGYWIDITDLKQTEEELLVKKHNLEEVNTALRVLLKQRQEDKKDFEERVLSNLRELVFPYMEDLKKGRLDHRQMSLLGVIESNLNDITAPFLRQLSSQCLSLTPREIQVAGLVREGRTTKEIAELLSSSTDAIDFHRKNLRKKLGITNSKTNLRTHLLSLL